MCEERAYKVIIKQYSPIEEAIILAGLFKTAEEADAIANQLSDRLVLKPNQYLAVCEEVWYRESADEKEEE